jgi:DNA-binding CsgD family transcriptional regulator
MSTGARPLVGREAEIAELDRALVDADAGASSALGILGEPGIGKSRILGELGRRATERGHLVLAGRGAELERDVPFALWTDALGRHIDEAADAGLSDLSEEKLADLAVALPQVGRATGTAPAATVERHRVARAVRALLERWAADHPLALLLDDVHWADPASSDVIALLLHRSPRGGVLLGLAARTGRAPALEDALQAAARHDGARVLELGALTAEAADALLPAGLGRAARARLYEESGGNPFYLEALSGADGQGAAAPAASVGARVPRGVVAALVGEVASLAPEARALAQGASVAGDPFDVAAAAAAAGVAEDAALATLDALLSADLVRPADRPRWFRFRHPLVRRAVYETAGGGWRIAAHARAARALAAGGASPAERAHHVERAAGLGDREAIELLTRAAEQTAPTAPATAAGWYEAAARLLPDAPEQDARRVALLSGQGLALAAAGRPGDARDVLRRVLGMLPREASAERVALVATVGDLEVLWTNNAESARRLLEAERSALGDEAPGLSAALTLGLVRERSVHGDHAGAEALACEAAAAARAAGDAPLEAEASAVAADEAHCALRRDDPEALVVVDAKIAAAQALIDALPDEQVAARLQMLFWLSVAHTFTGDHGQARAAAERGVRVARASGQGLFAPAFVCVRGWIDAERGLLDAAEADEEEARESALLSGNVQVAYWTAIALSRIALARGDVEAALGHGRAAWDRIGVIEYSQAGYCVADAQLAAGEPAAAAATLETFGWVQPALWTLDRVKACEVAVRTLLALDRVGEAEALARRAPAECGGRRSGVTGAILALAEAALLLARGRAHEAAAAAQAGAEAGDDGDAALWAARCRILAGEALAAAGEPEAARAALRRAAADLEARGAWGYRDTALRGLRRLGDRPRVGSIAAAARGDGDPLAAVSAREREVALLVAEGRTNAQIAARLHLSERTVEKHVSQALRKLGLSSRSGVVRLLAGEGTPPA